MNTRIRLLIEEKMQEIMDSDEWQNNPPCYIPENGNEILADSVGLVIKAWASSDKYHFDDEPF